MKLYQQPALDPLSVIAHRARAELLAGTAERTLLADLYLEYNPIEEVDLFVDRALQYFPSLNCGIASLYVHHLRGAGEIVRGSYRGINHTFYRAPCGRIVDLTADQFGGPAVYVGQLKAPWSGSPLLASGSGFRLTSPE